MKRISPFARAAITALSLFLVSDAMAAAQECAASPSSCGQAPSAPAAQQTPAQRAQGQTQKPRTPGPQPAQRESSERDSRESERGRPVNLTIEVTITDQLESEPAQKKTVSMVVADRMQGRVRSQGTVQAPGMAGPVVVQLNVDAHPEIQANESIRLRLTLEYQPLPPAVSADSARRPATLNESLVVFLQPGKPLTVSRAVDPFTNRRTSVDVTATIAK